MIAVIGATGYVGRYFCVEMKKRGIDVLALGRSQKAFDFLKSHDISCHYFDLNDDDCFDALPADRITSIVDLSACLAELETPVEQFFTVNTVGVYKVLCWARDHGIKKVVVSSSHKVYNDLNIDGAIDETVAPSFTGDHSPYIISKLAAERFIEYFNKDFGMNAVGLRFTGVHGYGEILGFLDSDGNYKKSAFEIFFEKILKGDNIEVWGNQSIKRDHIYIKDVVNALYCACIVSEAKGIFNIASGVAYSQLEEAKALIEVFSPADKKSKITLCPEKPGLSRGYLYSIDKAQRELNWKPVFTDLVDLYSDYKAEWLTKEYRNYHFFKHGQEPATL